MHIEEKRLMGGAGRTQKQTKKTKERNVMVLFRGFTASITYLGTDDEALGNFDKPILVNARETVARNVATEFFYLRRYGRVLDLQDYSVVEFFK
jgi:hypothetical protein